MQPINSVFNLVHEWGEPENSPVKRMLLTRLGSLGGAFLETCAILYESLSMGFNTADSISYLSLKSLSILFPKRFVKRSTREFHHLTRLKTNFMSVCKLVAGLASSLFFGVLFTPEVNFRCHLKLGLVVDNLNIRKQKELKTKLEAEIKAAEINRERANRYSQFQAQRKMAKELEEQENAIDAHLAELLRKGPSAA